MTVAFFKISIGVHVTSPSSEAGDISDDVSVKKAGRRGTKSATAPRALSDRRGKIMFVLYMYRAMLFCRYGHANLNLKPE